MGDVCDVDIQHPYDKECIPLNKDDDIVFCRSKAFWYVLSSVHILTSTRSYAERFWWNVLELNV